MKWNNKDKEEEEDAVDNKTIKTTTKGQKSNTVIVEYSREECETRIRDLQGDDEVALFIKVSNGERKFAELQKLFKLLE